MIKKSYYMFWYFLCFFFKGKNTQNYWNVFKTFFSFTKNKDSVSRTSWNACGVAASPNLILLKIIMCGTKEIYIFWFPKMSLSSNSNIFQILEFQRRKLTFCLVRKWLVKKNVNRLEEVLFDIEFWLFADKKNLCIQSSFHFKNFVYFFYKNNYEAIFENVVISFDYAFYLLEFWFVFYFASKNLYCLRLFVTAL